MAESRRLQSVNCTPGTTRAICSWLIAESLAVRTPDLLAAVRIRNPGISR